MSLPGIRVNSRNSRINFFACSGYLSLAMNRPKANWWKSFVRVLLTLVIAYVVLSLAIMFLQRRMIYIPTRLTTAQESQLAAENGFVPWRNPAGEIIGWELPAKGTAAGTVLIVHGNAGCAVDRDYLADPIHAARPVNVFVLEYPGYGARAGSPSEKSFLAAAEEAFATLTNRGPVYVVGESLGTGVAAYLAKTHGQQVAGLALLMPYNKLAAVAQAKMPLFPAGLLLWDRFDPEDWLKSYHGPIKFVLAGKDEIIPTKFGRRLFDSYNGPKSLQVIAGAHHNDVPQELSAVWWADVFAFWQQDRQPSQIPTKG